MIGFIIVLIIAFLAIHAWINYSKHPSVGRFFLAIFLTILVLPSLIGTIFKITTIALVIIAILAVIGSIAGIVSKNE